MKQELCSFAAKPIKKLTSTSKRFLNYLIDILSDKDLGHYPIKKLHQLPPDNRRDAPIIRKTTYHNPKNNKKTQ